MKQAVVLKDLKMKEAGVLKDLKMKEAEANCSRHLEGKYWDSRLDQGRKELETCLSRKHREYLQLFWLRCCKSMARSPACTDPVAVRLDWGSLKKEHYLAQNIPQQGT